MGSMWVSPMKNVPKFSYSPVGIHSFFELFVGLDD